MRRFDELTEDEKTEKLLRLGQKALSAYGLTGDLAFVAQRENTVFRLRTGGGSYAVHICAAGHDHAPLKRELLWLAALGRDTRLAVPEPVLTLTGDLFRSTSMEGVPGTRACMVLRWIDGERREAELTVDEAAAMGQFAAALHRHAEAFHWPEELATSYLDPAARVLTAADAVRGALTSPDDRTLLCDAVASIAEVTSTLGDGAGAVGIVHGALRLRKLRHDHGSVGAFGFDGCCIGAYLDDLSLLWTELAGREASLVLQRALLDGYRSVRDLAGEPESILRAFVVLRGLETAAGALGAIRANRLAPKEVAGREMAVVRQELVSSLQLPRRAGSDGTS
ncbi:MAG: phosphotransferase [Candidatus Bipolaricaulota bacterium]|nr:phosphotransferase [Candidatus Bipolaricaulota bacterium]